MPQEYFYNPLDLKPDVAIGVKLPFNKALGATADQSVNGGTIYSTNKNGSGVFNSSYTTEDQAISNLKSLVLTRRGERLYHPTFGTRLYEYVFEPNTDDLAEAIEDELFESIRVWLPYIIVDSIDVNNRDSFGNYGHSIQIVLRFRVTQQGANQEIIIIVSGDTINIIQ